MSDDLLYTGVVVALLAAAVVLGGKLAKRRHWRLLPMMAALTASVTALTVITGPFGTRSLAVMLAAALWAAVLFSTASLVRHRHSLHATVVSVVGGAIAINAALVAFVMMRFSSTEAPREYALHWLPAMLTGGATDLGAVRSETETPLFVNMSEDASLLPLLMVLLTGFALSYVVRRGALTRTAGVTSSSWAPATSG